MSKETDCPNCGCSHTQFALRDWETVPLETVIEALKAAKANPRKVGVRVVGAEWLYFVDEQNRLCLRVDSTERPVECVPWPCIFAYWEAIPIDAAEK